METNGNELETKAHNYVISAQKTIAITKWDEPVCLLSFEGASVPACSKCSIESLECDEEGRFLKSFTSV